MLKIINNNDLENYIASLKNQKKRIALVPTMGALHDGHLALVKEGMKRADICLPYIFLNPTQFAPNEDLESYPRTLEQDFEKLKNIGVEAVWLPSQEDIYPNGLETDIHVEGITEVLEGEHRPHFFDGVATVVARMLHLSKPDIAIFGEKDFQQLQVIRKMAQEQNIPTEIIGVPTMRDKNGLALSSRNSYLTEEEYQIAIELNGVLIKLAQHMITEQEAHNLLLDIGFDKVDYCTARNSQDFSPENPDRVLAAVWLGKTRLIDNMAIMNS